MKNPLKIVEILFLIFGTYFIMGCPGAPFSKHIVLERDSEGKNGHTQQVIEEFAYRPSYTNSSRGNAFVSIKIPIKVKDNIDLETLKTLFPPADDWKPGEKWKVGQEFNTLQPTKTLDIEFNYQSTSFPGGFQQYKPLFKTNLWTVEFNKTWELSSLGITVQEQGNPKEIRMVCKKYKCKIVDQDNNIVNEISIKRTITINKQKLAHVKNAKIKKKVIEIKKQEEERKAKERAARIASQKQKCISAYNLVQLFHSNIHQYGWPHMPMEDYYKALEQRNSSTFCKNYWEQRLEAETPHYILVPEVP